MANPLDSATPEQKLRILNADVRISLQNIRAHIEIIKSITEITSTENEIPAVERLEILRNSNNVITNETNKIEQLLDNIVNSTGFYKPFKNLSSIDILLNLRQQLLDAREQNDVITLRNLAIFFDMLSDIAMKKLKQGWIIGLLENLENTAYDSLRGIPWKSIIPSEEEIISALGQD